MIVKAWNKKQMYPPARPSIHAVSMYYCVEKRLPGGKHANGYRVAHPTHATVRNITGLLSHSIAFHTTLTQALHQP